MCGIKARNANEITSEASCLQTKSASAPPHVVNGTFIKNGNEWKIKSFQCSCKAGTSESCKHCVSVMLFCHENDISALEDLSVTDIKCTWNSVKLKNLHIPVPVQDFCHIKTPPEHNFPEVKKRNMCEEICNIFKETAYAKHLARFLEKKELKELPIPNAMSNDCVCNTDLAAILEKIFCRKLIPVCECTASIFDIQPEVHFFTENMHVTKDKAKNLALMTINQHSELWSSERQKRITGSICYKIYTFSKNKSPVWSSKMNKLLNSNFRGNLATSYGLNFEDTAREEYSKIYAIPVMRCGLLVHPEAPFLGYSPDGLIFCENGDIKLLEIKCPIQGSQKPVLDIIENLNYLVVDETSKYVLKKKHQFLWASTIGYIFNWC